MRNRLTPLPVYGRHVRRNRRAPLKRSDTFRGANGAARLARCACCFLMVCFLLTAIGCSGRAPAIALSPAARAELTGILDTLQVRYDLTGSLKTTRIRVIIEDNDRREELRESLWYKKSARGGELLHIQALGAANEPRGVAIANQDENRFVLHLLNEQKTYFGTLSDGVLREIFGIDLRVSDMLSALFANPFLDGRTDTFLSAQRSGAKLVITRPGPETGQIETITVFTRDSEPRVTDWQTQDASGAVQQRVTFGDYREVGGILRPHRVEIERPREQTRVVIQIAKVELNVEIPDSKFNAERFFGDGIEVVPLSELEE